MKPRLSYAKAAPGAYEAMDALERYLKDCGLDQRLLMLVQLRASQINGCAYCLDMHWKDLVAAGEKELCDLTLAVATINAWNRLSIAARTVPGAYQPAPPARPANAVAAAT